MGCMKWGRGQNGGTTSTRYMPAKKIQQKEELINITQCTILEQKCNHKSKSNIKSHG